MIFPCPSLEGVLVMFRLFLSVILATGVSVGAAYAQDTQKPKKQRPTAEEKYKQLNKAGDGKLTLSEFLEAKKKRAEAAEKAVQKAKEAFKAADKDNKGYLTLDQFKAIYDHPHHGGHAHHRRHKNHNGDTAPEKTTDKPADTPPASK